MWFDDQEGKLNEKGQRHFRWIPNGIPGVGSRLPILFSEGVMKGRISLNQFVQLTSTNHARLCGLYPQKGTIAIGADADITLWDRNRECVLTNDMLQHGADYTPYEGLTIRGWPTRVLLRGKTIVMQDALLSAGSGQYLKRQKSALSVSPVQIE